MEPTDLDDKGTDSSSALRDNGITLLEGDSIVEKRVRCSSGRAC